MGPNDEALFALTHDETIEEFIKREIKEGIRKELDDRIKAKSKSKRNSPLVMASSFNSLPDEERERQFKGYSRKAWEEKRTKLKTLKPLTEKEKFDNKCSANMRDYLRGK